MDDVREATIGSEARRPARSAYELKPDEIVQPVIAAGGLRLTHYLRPPSQADWEAYEAELHVSVDRPPEGIALHSEELAAANALWQRIVLRVEGYEPLDDWRERVPLPHRRAAVRPLTQVYSIEPEASGEQAYRLAADRIEVELVAGPNYTGLRHIFRPATALEAVEFERVRSAAIWARESPGRTVYPAKLAGYVKLYDALILKVEGYTIAGEPCTGREQAVQDMDAMHKQAAVRALFGRDHAESGPGN